MDDRKPAKDNLKRGKLREARVAPGLVVPFGLLTVVGITRLDPDRFWPGQRQRGLLKRR